MTFPLIYSIYERTQNRKMAKLGSFKTCSDLKLGKSIAIIKVTVFLIVAIPLAFIQFGYSQETDTWKTYTNVNEGYTVQYPSSWTLGAEKRDNIFTSEVISTVNIGLKDKGTDDKVTEVEFRVQKVPEQVQTLEDLRNRRILQLSQGEDPLKIINYSSTTLSNQPAFRTLFDRPEMQIMEGIPPLPEKEVLTITTLNATPHEAFIISYFANPSLFEEYLPTVEEMVRSFRFTN